MKKTRNQKGITLIALVITIIILLILALVTLNIFLGDNGLINKIIFTGFIAEYTSVDEAKNMYIFEREIDKVNKTIQVGESIYPVNTSADASSMSESLKYCIIKQENIEEEELTNTDLVNLKFVDFSKISTKANRQYVINTVNGNLYSIEGEKKDGRRYHTLNIGVNANSRMILPGNYELIIDAGEGKMINWEVLRVYYDKYVPNSAEFKVYTSDDKDEWTEQEINSRGVNNNEEDIAIVHPEITRYLKIEVKIKSINDDNSEISNILVNFYGFRESSVVPYVNATGVSEMGNMYIVSTPSNGQVTAQGTGTVTQTISIPNDTEKYVINAKIMGTPTTIARVSDGTQYTIENESDFSKIQLNPGTEVVITSTLSAGDGIEKAKVLVEDRTQMQQISESKASGYIGDTWKTKDEKTYIYDNGGIGVWESASINGINIGDTGIINQDNKRIRVTYQSSEDGERWSREFTNIQDAENIRYLKVRVEYQVNGDGDYGDTKSNVLAVILNDGSHKARFLDEDGTKLFIDRIYFTNRNEKVQYTLPGTSLQKEGKVFAGWIYQDEVFKSGSKIDITDDIEFVAKYRTELGILSNGKASFVITPNTKWQESVTVTINNMLQDEDTTILQYKIGTDGAWTTYTGEFPVTTNTQIYGRFYNILTEEVGYEFNSEVNVIDDVSPQISITSKTPDARQISVQISVSDEGCGMAGTPTYKYYISTDRNNYGTATESHSTTNTFTGLTPATKYYIKVETTDKKGNYGSVETEETTTNPTYVTGITVSPISNNYTVIGINETTTLQASITPANADNKTVTWSTSSNSIASITTNANGTVTVTGKGTGNVTITATANDGSNVKGSFQIEVFNGTIITTRAQLATIKGGGNYKLGCDIDLSKGGNWEPLNTNSRTNPFTLDGCGYSIKNLTINTTANYTGMFGDSLNATISNIKFTNVNVQGGQMFRSTFRKTNRRFIFKYWN